ncbi:hypothetical protein SBA5_970041 [Candidatus Sulfotelmatomonas gaucii]|uniref:Uncharacterized protein n=1 Tax=Candidatus Sulfuritelmatomonas gaucii TaxID=2043161 RepID=A0A2N9MA24_9BACT|nr:hypothetical protein SBA5_970041 [Candidatus Sulfotelmatomonas gaucii]
MLYSGAKLREGLYGEHTTLVSRENAMGKMALVCPEIQDRGIGVKQTS